MVAALGIWLAAFFIGYQSSWSLLGAGACRDTNRINRSGPQAIKESQLFREIVANNFKVITINFTGLGTLGFSTLVNLFSNGYLAGNVVLYAHRKGLYTKEIFALVLPHSIELWAFWLSGGIGIALGLMTFRLLKGLYPRSSEMLCVFILSVYSYLLTLIAGLCEVYITLRKL